MDREPTKSMQNLKSFLFLERRSTPGRWSAVSLFSGAGLSDLGYELAGFQFKVQAELNPLRAFLGEANFPRSKWVVGDVREKADEIVKAFQESNEPLDLLVATPPCQGMSSSNPSRGKRQGDIGKSIEEKNRLILAVFPIVQALKPRLVVVENVRQILSVTVKEGGRDRKVIDLFKEGLGDYDVFCGVVNVADYGVPQDRRRAVVVAVRRQEQGLKWLRENSLLPWPRATHSDCPAEGVQPWVSVRRWLEFMEYEPLDAGHPEKSRGKDALHCVPQYSGDRYLLVRDIPPYSGRTAYQNEACPNCGFQPVPESNATCPSCDGVMRNRPYVIQKDSTIRLVKGFRSSYRRMSADRPAATVTTNSSSLGSDFKIHPWENRVLSIRECADLQTVPRYYDWSRALSDGRSYLVRNVVGEAFPPYFTYLHGQVLGMLLDGKDFNPESFTVASRERTKAGKLREILA